MAASLGTYISRGKNKVNTFRTKTFNIDNGAGTTDDDVWYLPYKTVILAAYKVYTEATDTTGAASANVRAGVAAAGATVIASTALDVATAVGAGVACSVLINEFAAGTTIFTRHTGVATTEVGQYFVEYLYYYKD